jgi:lipopolysaccharide export system permease protein
VANARDNQGLEQPKQFHGAVLSNSVRIVANMSMIASFLTRMIVLRFVTILLCITIFVITLELVGYISEILNIESNSFISIIKYLTYRSPGVLAVFLPMSLLLALLLTITELTYRNEMTAIFAAGISPFRIIIMLLPMALIIGGLQFILLDRAIPATTPTLKLWGIGDYAKNKINVSNSDPIWIRSGTDIMRATKVNADGKHLEGVIIFRRDEAGALKEQIYAEQADQEQDRWRLTKVVVYYNGSETPTRLESLIYSGTMRPAGSNRTGDPEDMNIGELGDFISNQGYGVRPVSVYQTGWHKRVSSLIIGLVMIMLCIPMAAKFRRGGGLGVLFAIGVALGFLFFISDGIATTLGELGIVAPWLAAWTPLLIFSAIGFSFIARTERV